MIINLCVLYDVSELYDNILKDKSFETALATSGSIPPLRLTLSPPSFGVACPAKETKNRAGGATQHDDREAPCEPACQPSFSSMLHGRAIGEMGPRKKKNSELGEGKGNQRLKKGVTINWLEHGQLCICSARLRRRCNQGGSRSIVNPPPSAPPKLEMMVDLDDLDVFFMPGFKK